MRNPVCQRGNAGVPWTYSIIPLFAQKRSSDKVLAPARCGNGHKLTPDNLVPAERGSRDWACYSFHHRRRPQAGELRFQFLDPSIAFLDCCGYVCGFKALGDVLRAIGVPRTDLK